MTPELEKKVTRALALIKSASKMAERVHQPLEVCYSGGKDSDVILELAKMADVPYRAIYKNTTIDPPGTVKHARDLCVEITPPKQTFRQIIEQKGMPNRWRRFCCGVLKEYKVLDYALVGVRRAESRARRERYHEPEMCRVYNKKKDIRSRQYYPILDWTDADVAEFIAARSITCHPLYYDEQGNFHVERRLGCLCCPLQSRNKRIASFKEYPGMVRFYIHAAQKFLTTHPRSKIYRSFDGNVYDWFVSQVFCDGEAQFRDRFGASTIPGLFNAIDTKAYIEEQFGIKL